MAATKGTSGLLAKMGSKLKGAWNKHRTKEVEYNQFTELPGGIVDGVAQLVEAKFDKYKEGKNKGQLYCYLAGTVVSPEEFNGAKIAGRRTSIMLAMCDTVNSKGEEKSADQNLAAFANTLLLLGLDISELEWEDVEGAVTSMTDDGIHFNFSTREGKASKQFPNPRVFHSWGGACTAPEGSGDDANDDSDDEDGDGEATAYAPPAGRNGKANPKTGKKGPPPDDLEFGDVDSLVKKAKKGDVEAQNTLTAMAKEAGAAPLKVKKAVSAKDWGALADLTGEAKREGDNDDESPEAEAEAQEEADGAVEDGDDEGDGEPEPPEVGGTFGYKPPKAKKPVQCEVVKVFSKSQTCNLQSLEDEDVTFEKVSWSALIPE